jgi:hypothetical protein
MVCKRGFSAHHSCAATSHKEKKMQKKSLHLASQDSHDAEKRTRKKKKKVLHGRAGSRRKDLARDQTPRGRPPRPTAGSRRPWVGFFFFFFLPVPVSDFYFFLFFIFFF